MPWFLVSPSHQQPMQGITFISQMEDFQLPTLPECREIHCSDVIMSTMASQITSLTIVYSTVYSGADQSKTTSNLSVTGLCAGDSPVTGEFPAQRASNAENVFIWLRRHDGLGRQGLWSLRWDGCRSLSHNFHFCRFDFRTDSAHKLRSKTVSCIDNS